MRCLTSNVRILWCLIVWAIFGALVVTNCSTGGSGATKLTAAEFPEGVVTGTGCTGTGEATGSDPESVARMELQAIVAGADGSPCAVVQPDVAIDLRMVKKVRAMLPEGLPDDLNYDYEMDFYGLGDVLVSRAGTPLFSIRVVKRSSDDFRWWVKRVTNAPKALRVQAH